MRRRTIGTILVAAGLVTGSFLAGGALFGSGGSGATGATGPTGGTGELNPLATATFQPTTTNTPVITVAAPTATAVTTAGPTGPSGGGVGTGLLNPAPPTQAPIAVPPTAAPPTAIPPTAIPPVPPTPVPPTPPVIVVPTPAVLEPVNAAPTVDSVTPEDGANGIGIASNIVVTFSEEMDQASAEAAFSLLPNVAGTFSWDETATIMTFNPNANFAYNSDVTWEIESSAADLLGKEMAKGVSGSFEVLRQSTFILSAEPSRDGHVYAPPVAANPKVSSNGLTFRVGTWMRGFLSFDLSDLPAETTYISEAYLQVNQVDHSAGAYGGETGNLYAFSVPYGTLTIDDYAKPALEACFIVCGPVNILLSSSASDIAKSTEVTAFVRRDWNVAQEAGETPRSQLRLQFQNENQGAGSSIWAEFAAAESGFQGSKLTVTVIHK